MDIVPSKNLPSKRTLAKNRKGNTLRVAHAAEKLRRDAFNISDNVAGEAVPLEPTLKDVGLIERAKANHHTRRTLLIGAGTYSPTEWLALCDKQDNRCLRCFGLKPLSVDHVVPLSRGGSNTIENLQGLCRECNSIKGTDDTDYRKP